MSRSIAMGFSPIYRLKQSSDSWIGWRLAVEGSSIRGVAPEFDLPNETKINRIIAAISDGLAKAPAGRPAGGPAVRDGAGAGTPGRGPESGDVGHGSDSRGRTCHTGSLQQQGRGHQAGGDFFKEAITPIEKTHHAALKANVRLRRLRKTLGRRTVDLRPPTCF